MSEITQQQDTRREFVDTLIELAEKDDRIVVVIPDVGFNYLERFQERFPNRFFNTGVTEQASMAICGGLALAGLKPYFYTMLNFSVFRPFEMVRNCVALHKANVKILGVKGSEKYKFLGFSHNMVFDDEDIYHLEKYLPCYKPQSNMAVREITKITYQNNSPCYIRL